MDVYVVRLSHVACPGTHIHAFSDRGAAIKCATDHVRDMYAERRKDASEWGCADGLKIGSVTLANWEEYADALDDWEGDGYVCVDFAGPLTVDAEASA